MAALPALDAPPRRPGRIRRALHALPTLLAFAALAGLMLWGHRTGWSIARPIAAAADDWCGDHAVPESACVECHPELLPRPPAFGWCRTHGISECPHCHPEVAQVTGTPSPVPFDPAAALALLPRPENNIRCRLHQRRVQFASTAAADKAGVDVDVVGTRPMTEVVTANGEVGYDPTAVVRLSTRASGVVRRVFKVVGDSVRAGEVVALIDAAEVGRAKAEYAAAVVGLRLRLRSLEMLKAAAGAVSEQDVRAADATAEEARVRRLTAEQSLANLGLPVPAGLDAADPAEVLRRLRFLGLPANLEYELGKDPAATNNLLPLLAPQPGLVVSCDTVAGEVVDSAKVLAVTADTRRMWLTLNARQEDARHLTMGKAVRFRPDGGGPELAGTLSWVSTAVDDRTRTVRARADIPNPDGTLRANTFGTGRVILREQPNAIAVPAEAVQWEGCCHVVFVRDRDYLMPGSPKVFHVRQVRPGATADGQVELLAGVRPGEVIAVKGAGVLRAELLKNGLGEGCACHKH